MKVRALKTFEGIKDLERDTYPKAGDVWEVTEERANFLKSHGVVEFVEEEIESKIVPLPNAKPEDVEIIPVPLAKEDVEITPAPLKYSKKKKHSKK